MKSNKKPKRIRKFLGIFPTPIKGILDIILIMTCTTLAVVYLGPIVIQKSSDLDEVNEVKQQKFKHEDSRGRIIKDYIIDEETGETTGWIDIEYHENGAFKTVTEHNQKENKTKQVHYSEENKFLYWYETLYDQNGEELSVVKYDADGKMAERIK